MTAPIHALGLADPASSLTHLVGAVVFALLAIPMLRKARGCPVCRVSIGVFVGSAVLLLSASGIFHALPSHSAIRNIFQRLDHAAIFVLIAGTMTPIHAILFRGPMRWGILIPIWVFALLGIIFKTMFFSTTPEWLGISIYLLMGWSGSLSMVAVWRRFGLRFVSPLILGGLAYTVGALSEFTGEPTLIPGIIGSHEVFHLAVLVGLGTMWWFVYRIADGKPAPMPLRRSGSVQAGITPPAGAPR